MAFSNYEVPLNRGFGYSQSGRSKMLPVTYITEYIVKDEVNNEDVRSLPVASRNCRFPDENRGILRFPFYSFSACIAQCKEEERIRLCNCTDGYFIGKYSKYFPIHE